MTPDAHLRRALDDAEAAVRQRTGAEPAHYYRSNEKPTSVKLSDVIEVAVEAVLAGDAMLTIKDVLTGWCRPGMTSEDRLEAIAAALDVPEPDGGWPWR